jgi:CRP-like cAMP-binding protein
MLLENPCGTCQIVQDCILRNTNLPNADVLTEALITFHFKRGQALFLEGDHMKGIYFIRHGKIKCVKSEGKGKEVLFQFAGKGDVLGHSVLYTKRALHEFGSISMEDTDVCFLPWHAIKNDLHQHVELLKCLAQVQYQDFLSLMWTTMNVCVNSVRERLAHSILHLSQKFGLDPEGFIDISITREEMANMAATSTESSIRFISEFQKEKIICVKNKKIKILDPAKLNKLTNQHNNQKVL